MVSNPRCSRRVIAMGAVACALSVGAGSTLAWAKRRPRTPPRDEGASSLWCPIVIVPGVSLGPFAIGQTTAEARAAATRDGPKAASGADAARAPEIAITKVYDYLEFWRVGPFNVELCGGRNVFATLPQLAPPIAVEAVIAADPQVILSTDDTIADPAAQWRSWQRLTAVRYRTIYPIHADTVARSTPRHPPPGPQRRRYRSRASYTLRHDGHRRRRPMPLGARCRSEPGGAASIVADSPLPVIGSLGPGMRRQGA